MKYESAGVSKGYMDLTGHTFYFRKYKFIFDFRIDYFMFKSRIYLILLRPAFNIQGV